MRKGRSIPDLLKLIDRVSELGDRVFGKFIMPFEKETQKRYTFYSELANKQLNRVTTEIQRVTYLLEASPKITEIERAEGERIREVIAKRGEVVRQYDRVKALIENVFPPQRKQMAESFGRQRINTIYQAICKKFEGKSQDTDVTKVASALAAGGVALASEIEVIQKIQSLSNSIDGLIGGRS